MYARKLLTDLSIIALLCVIAVTGMVFITWRIAYAPDPNPPTLDSLHGLRGDVQISWGEAGDAQIDAPNELAATSGLGYVHGWNHATIMVVLRQSALGRLGEWFGIKAIPADSLARSLGLAQLAKESLTRLHPGERNLLHAYAEGVSAAWAHSSVALRHTLLFIGYEPEPWQPWHTLAIERLMGYLAAEVHCVQNRSFCHADSTLRAMTHVHGFDANLVWAVRHDGLATLYQRHVYGNTALSVFQEVVVRTHGASPLLGLTLVGTPFFVGGQSNHGSWAVLLGSDAHLTHETWSSSPYTYERMVDDTGREYLSRFSRISGKLLVAQTTDSTAWVFNWSGLTAGSDMATWHALPKGRATPFARFSHTQLRIDSDGRWQVTGRTPVRLENAHGILISQDTLARHLLAPDPSWGDVTMWMNDMRSMEASTILPVLLSAMEKDQPPRKSHVHNALTYLDNWDYRYSHSSIGASVFASWMQAYHARTGLPVSTSATDTALLFSTLEEAIQALSANYGSNQGMWQWGMLNPDRRHFAAAHAPRGDNVSQFAPLEWPGQGYGGTPRWGPSTLGVHPQTASAVLELWHSAHWDGQYTVRRRPIPEIMNFNRRHTLLEREPRVYSLPSQVGHTTALER